MSDTNTCNHPDPDSPLWCSTCAYEVRIADLAADLQVAESRIANMEAHLTAVCTAFQGCVDCGEFDGHLDALSAAQSIAGRHLYRAVSATDRGWSNRLRTPEPEPSFILPLTRLLANPWPIRASIFAITSPSV